ncbi:unnamed protein product, partial [marine sediment metagenome]
MKICKIKGCGDRVRTREWCNKHYERWRIHGSPNIVKGHGYSNHHLYKVWQHMKQRCYNENHVGYKNYGGRGIAVCSEWISSPKTFIDWALPLWKEGLQIDRMDNNGNYEPSNCRFITHAENQLNSRLLQRN